MSEVAITLVYRYQPPAGAPIDAGELVADTGKVGDYRYYLFYFFWLLHMGVADAPLCNTIETSAGSNTVTLSRPKGESNREHKADLHTGGVLSTRPGNPHGLLQRSRDE